MPSLLILLNVGDFGLLSPALAICQMSQVKVNYAQEVNVALCILSRTVSVSLGALCKMLFGGPYFVKLQWVDS